VFEPHLDTIEKWMGNVCRLEECKPEKDETKPQRAERLARAVVLWGAAFVPSLAAKLAVRRGINQLQGRGDQHPWWKIWKFNKHDGTVLGWDEGVHIG